MPGFEVEPTTTISAMKQKFQNAIGIPKENFIFKFNGETLEDAMTLTHYKIPDDGLLDIEGILLATLRPRYVNMCNMDNMLSKLAEL
jgi:hypothetical protein